MIQVTEIFFDYRRAAMPDGFPSINDLRCGRANFVPYGHFGAELVLSHLNKFLVVRADACEHCSLRQVQRAHEWVQIVLSHFGNVLDRAYLWVGQWAVLKRGRMQHFGKQRLRVRPRIQVLQFKFNRSAYLLNLIIYTFLLKSYYSHLIFIQNKNLKILEQRSIQGVGKQVQYLRQTSSTTRQCVHNCIPLLLFRRKF